MAWIELSKYSSKYKISVSALREKIHLNQIDFVFHLGKYKIRDEPLDKMFSFVEDLKGREDLTQIDQKIRNLVFQLQKKKKDFEDLKNQYDDLKNLCYWLEEENKKMRHIINGVNRIDSFLKNE